MHKSVRYYITESNDQPVVRSVHLSERLDQADDVTPNPEANPIPQAPAHRRLSPATIARKLKPERSAGADS